MNGKSMDTDFVENNSLIEQNNINLGHILGQNSDKLHAGSNLFEFYVSCVVLFSFI